MFKKHKRNQTRQKKKRKYNNNNICIRNDEVVVMERLHELKLNYNNDTIRGICLFKKFVNYSVMNGLIILFNSIKISNI